MHIHWTVEVALALNRGHQVLLSAPAEGQQCSCLFGQWETEEESAAQVDHSQEPPTRLISQVGNDVIIK